jgi:hypothetical protein
MTTVSVGVQLLDYWGDAAIREVDLLRYAKDQLTYMGVYNLGVSNNLIVGGSITGNGLNLTNLNLSISGTNATPPEDGATIKAWMNVTLPDGTVWKAPLYQ